MSFPSAVPSYNGFTSSHTLAQDNHASQHNAEQADIVALATKTGTGSSTPTNNTVLRGTGTGTSSWAPVNQSTDVTGVLATVNGGTGTTATTGSGSVVFSNSPTLSSITSSNDTFTKPTIADFTNANHNHENAVGGGQLTASTALTTGSLTAGVVGTDSSWAWTSYTPTLTNITLGNGTSSGFYIQVGKTVHFRWRFTMGSTSAMGSSPSFTLPKTPKDMLANTSHFRGLANASTQGYDFVAIFTGGTTLALHSYNATFTYNLTDVVSSTAPFSWTTGNALEINGTYETT